MLVVPILAAVLICVVQLVTGKPSATPIPETACARAGRRLRSDPMQGGSR